MKTNIYILILFFSSLANTNLFAQDCYKFHDSNLCKPARIDYEMKPYGQSKSALVEVGETYRIKIVLNGDKDYMMSFCTKRGFEPVHYKLTDIESGEVLFDNKEDDYIESIGFTNENTRIVMIEITVLAENINTEKQGNSRVCVGMNILWKKIPKLGF